MPVESAGSGGPSEGVAWNPEEVTVHEALGRVEGAAAVFERFGLDTCCGGELPVAAAAEHHGVELERLLDALSAAAPEDAT